MRSLPLRIPLPAPEGMHADASMAAPARLVVRGEAFMAIDAFEAFNRAQEEAGEPGVHEDGAVPVVPVQRQQPVLAGLHAGGRRGQRYGPRADAVESEERRADVGGW